MFGYEVRLVSPDRGDVTEPNVPGEAWIKSKTACFFYWRKYDKSRETFIGEWTRTGDNLYFDEDGFFWFAGRDNDMFKVKGMWVTPIEIEAALTAHPAVREAAVVSFTDDDGFTKPMAYVVLRQGFAQSDALIAELCAAVRPLGGYKVPERYAFIDELPRTTLHEDRPAGVAHAGLNPRLPPRRAHACMAKSPPAPELQPRRNHPISAGSMLQSDRSPSLPRQRMSKRKELVT